MPWIRIGEREISEESKAFIIAEAGVNHEGDLDTAKRMIELAAQAGADAIKFQTYKAEKLAARESPAYWDTDKTQRDFFRQYDRFGKDEYLALAEYAQKCGIIFLSTPFDEEAVDFLEPVMPAYKVASSEITNLPFLRYIARKGKPILLSTGASTLEEIRRAILAIESEGNDQIVLMHCVLSYPTPYDMANLRIIEGLRQQFPQYLVGYSDHTIPDRAMVLPVAAYILGARVIEKHYTLDKTLPGNDHYHAMDPDDLRLLVENLHRVHAALGQRERKILDCERLARQYARRSLVTSRDIRAGEVLSPEMLTAKRPGTGISPVDLALVIGRRARRDIPGDTILSFDDLE
ncbi:MAG: acetylneuraminic acid synthetase [Candidatus Latescibacterota bacterium]|nr:MAG: acetylneuraminic acid synthetase [Candidatus Latescibacterota bacterium]